MATILTVSASPSARSKTARTRHLIDGHLTAAGHTVHPLDVRDLPPAALLAADTSHPAIAAAIGLFEQADGVVVATPVYKASYSGLLKTLLDLLPQRALADKVVLPLATGGSLAHVLVLDYALRPVLTALGSSQIVQGYFLLDQFVTFEGDGGVDAEGSGTGTQGGNHAANQVGTHAGAHTSDHAGIHTGIHGAGPVTIAPDAKESLLRAVDRFSHALANRTAIPALAA